METLVCGMSVTVGRNTSNEAARTRTGPVAKIATRVDYPAVNAQQKRWAGRPGTMIRYTATSFDSGGSGKDRRPATPL
jgi:hypothetical protein